MTYKIIMLVLERIDQNKKIISGKLLNRYTGTLIINELLLCFSTKFSMLISFKNYILNKQVCDKYKRKNK
jgi:hypothetical protein